MRIDQLTLRAFGKFTDRTIDLSEGQQGLHIIYGQNEAGKSTSLRAIADWLFGFQRSTDDDFIHPYKNLRVGGVLRDPQGNTLGLLRRKATSNSLRDLEDREAIPETSLAAFLGNISREDFANMFGIDQVRLRRGGEDLVQNRGQVGEAIFAGASGINQLRAISDSFKVEMQNLFTPRGGEIGKKLQAYRDKDMLLKSEFVTANHWNELQRRLNEALQRREDLSKKINQRNVEINRLQRIHENLQAVNSWCELQKQWFECQDFHLLEDDFGQITSRLVLRLTVLTTEVRTLDNEKQINEAKIRDLAEPRGLERYCDRLETLKLSEGTYRANRRQLPKFQEDRSGLQTALFSIYESLEQAPEKLELDSLRSACRRKVTVSKLIEERTGIEQDVGNCKTLFKSKKIDLDSTRSELEKLKVAPNLSNLKVRFKRMRDENPAARLDEMKRQLANKEREVADLFAQVASSGLSHGLSIEDLSSERIPSKIDIEQFQSEELDLQTRKSKHSDAIQSEQVTLSERTTALAHLESNAAIATLDDLRATREMRDSAWDLVKDRWIEKQPKESVEEKLLKDAECIGSIAEALESLIQKADGISDELREDAKKVAEKFSLQRDIAISESRIHTFHELFKECEASLVAWRKRWKMVWSDVGIDAKSPREMLTWVVGREDLLKSHRQQEDLRKEVAGLVETAESFRSELERLLQDSEASLQGSTRDFQELLSIADDFVEKQTNVEQRVSELENRLRSLEDAIKQVELDIQCHAESQENWQRKWAGEMELLMLPAETSCFDADRILEQYDSLQTKLERRLAIDREIETMQSENHEFLIQVTNLYRDFGFEDPIADDGVAANQALSRMDHLANEDKTVANQRAELRDQEEKRQKEISAKDLEIDLIRTQLNQYLAKTNKDSIEHLELASEESKRRKQVQSRIDELRSMLSSQAPGGNVEAFVAEVQAASLDLDRLLPDIENGKREVAELEKELEQAREDYHQVDAEIKQLRERDRSTQTNMECESLASEIEEQFRDLMVAKLCSVVLQDGIEKFREQNQAPILKAASQYFQEMTVNRFEELRVDWEDDKPVLMAVSADSGAALGVSKLSDGTRDQLYLALRLASIQEWLERHPPLPFIVDDLLIHFDNERAQATLKALARLSNLTQVVFFTHHQHLVDLARESIPEQLFVHEL